MAMEDQDVSIVMVGEVYLNPKGKTILATAKAMRQSKAVFLGALIEKYGEAYIADLRKAGIKEAPKKKASNPI